MEEGQYRIILVEDNPITTMSLSLFLKDERFHVVDEIAFAEGLAEKLDEKQADILVMDIMLKGVETGLDAAKKIREKHDIPILFVSALSDSETLREIQSISRSTYLTKPFEYSEFKRLIVKLVKGEG